ncbi:MAG: TonB-dependent receptor [Pseudomonadota bacterium]
MNRQPRLSLPAPSQKLCLTLALSCCSAGVLAGGEQALDTVVVTGASGSGAQVGVADSANVGTVSKQQLAARTVYRPGELLEATPGLIVSQHSGEGKANQFYLRGFNLDHGTDLRTTVDGMVVNQRSHAHGQGWTDLNFLIPELASRMTYKKGPYYAQEGDFSSAGAVDIRYADTLDKGIASVGLGEDGFRRVLLADSPSVGNGAVLYALEHLRKDGPFVNPEGFHKFNGVLRYSQATLAEGFNLTAMVYQARWNSTDQIPQRAVDAGALGRFDTIDSTDGGESHRYSLSGAWRTSGEGANSQVNAYLVDSKLALFSNFTYFLDDPVNGDQFAQPDNRKTTGVAASHTWAIQGLGSESENTVGVQFQNDSIDNGLLSTAARRTLSTTRRDRITETSVGLYFENATRWRPWFRTVAGARADTYKVDVRSDTVANSGQLSATLANPKLSLIFGPWRQTEYYLNLGGGFHSNDARGATITVDPRTGADASRVPLIARSKGAEVGVRTSLLPGWQTAFSVYQLDSGSELTFAGDAGTTEAGRPSRRNGFELANYYKLSDWLTVDADLAFARARFQDADPDGVGSRIPGAVEGVASLALAVDNVGRWSGAAQFRYFGPRPLIEDNSVRSRSTHTVNGRVGHKLSPSARIELEGFNLTNRQASAIDYYYPSRLQGEPAGGADDVHFHPIEPRSFRLSFITAF